jgi:D-aminopeptidase
MDSQRRRFRELGFTPGNLPSGTWNAITDVPGVQVGHVTLFQGTDIRTGVTSILPHTGNLYQDRVPAGIAVGNGFGKLIGSTQIEELGEIETPIVLTNTLAAPRAAEALIDWSLAQPGNEEVHSVNPVAGETNDGRLNDIRRIAVTKAHIHDSIKGATSGLIAEGNVGAGTGTICFGWKGGIGTSSRVVSGMDAGYIVGVLVQSNFGGTLLVQGEPSSTRWAVDEAGGRIEEPPVDGSIMMIVATDAPLSDRNLKRLARRAMAGLTRTGAAMSDGSGDYAIAFSTAEGVRRTAERRGRTWAYPEVPNSQMSALFQGTIEASVEAIYNSLCMAEDMTGYRGRTVQAIHLGAFGEPGRPK